MVVGQRWVLKHEIKGDVSADDFELVEEELPPVKDGEIMIKTTWISVDPYQRAFVSGPPVTMIGSSVGIIEESKNAKWPVGSTVVCDMGWISRAVINPDEKVQGTLLPRCSMAPEIKISPSHLLGAAGMTGFTAYMGLTEICRPVAGDTVVVSGAAGAVGSLVGQVAKIRGATVIGYAGSDDKVDWLKELGFDHAFNYKKVTIAESLAKAAPNGVDCYFDNVGGQMTIDIMEKLNLHGRIAFCGAVSQYQGSKKTENQVDVLTSFFFKQLRGEGFLFTRWMDRWVEGITAMADLIAEGKVKTKETVVEGFANTPEAFVGLFKGDNTGKMMVKVD